MIHNITCTYLQNDTQINKQLHTLTSKLNDTHIETMTQTYTHNDPKNIHTQSHKSTNIHTQSQKFTNIRSHSHTFTHNDAHTNDDDTMTYTHFDTHRQNNTHDQIKSHKYLYP